LLLLPPLFNYAGSFPFASDLFTAIILIHLSECEAKNVKYILSTSYSSKILMRAFVAFLRQTTQASERD
jgi:hypothetical protein